MSKTTDLTPFDKLSQIALLYGERSFENYAKIRSVAERLQRDLCAYLDGGQKCVFLVPPQGAFSAQNYGSAAFSVSGKGFLPLEPISFGLGVRVSHKADFMRIVLHCRKEGERVFVQIEENMVYELDLPVNDEDMSNCIEGLYQHLYNWFSDRVERYDHGNYGVTDIGFDIHRVDEETTS